ncbi:Ohr family peroxiredoxin [Salinibacterium sp. GXW1014]|uniref:Ohr family peroxiredoxin n=1 Tax=Salinibacterium sp. GXW1014 TaxID=3377838 RepID=UPI00383B8E67
MKYTAQATTDGNGRNGAVRTNDGLIDLRLGIPKEIGGAGGDVSNPEQLFAAGYSACFMSALSTVARQERVKLVDASVTAFVTIAHDGEAFGLSVELVADLPGVDSAIAGRLLEGAHAKCPYSRAVSGNIPVTVRHA